MYYNVIADRHVRILLIIGGEKLCQVIMIFLFGDDISKVIKASMNQNNHKEIDSERTVILFIKTPVKLMGFLFRCLQNGCKDKNDPICYGKLVTVI